MVHGAGDPEREPLPELWDMGSDRGWVSILPLVCRPRHSSLEYLRSSVGAVSGREEERTGLGSHTL